MFNSNYSFQNIFSEFKRSLQIAMPLIISEVVYGLNGFISTIFVAHLGKVQLAANVLVWNIYLAVILFFFGSLVAVNIMVSQSYGAKDNHGISQSFKQSITLSIIFSIPMMLIMAFAPMILNLLQEPPEVIEYAKPLFYALIWGMLPLNLYVIMEQLLIGLTKTRLAMAMSIIVVPIQIFFFYGFLYGRFGLPELGLKGIGYSLSLSYCIAPILFGLYFYYAPGLKVYQLFHQWWKINKKFLLELIRVGLPLGFLYCIEVALYAAIALMMGRLGTNTLAAYQITYQYWMMALTFTFALSQTVTTRVGYEVGQNNKVSLKRAFLVNLAINLIFTLLFFIAYLIFPHTLVNLDLNARIEQNRWVVQEAIHFLSIVSILLLIDSLRLLGIGALRGIKDTRFPVIASVIGFWGIAFPLAYIAAFQWHLGGTGILWSLVAGVSVSGIILFLRFHYLIQRIDLSRLVTK